MHPSPSQRLRGHSGSPGRIRVVITPEGGIPRETSWMHSKGPGRQPMPRSRPGLSPRRGSTPAGELGGGPAREEVWPARRAPSSALRKNAGRGAWLVQWHRVRPMPALLVAPSGAPALWLRLFLALGRLLLALLPAKFRRGGVGHHCQDPAAEVGVGGRTTRGWLMPWARSSCPWETPSVELPPTWGPGDGLPHCRMTWDPAMPFMLGGCTPWNPVAWWDC